MKVEGIKCISVTPEGETLTLVLSETTFTKVEKALVGKTELSVYTDNEEVEELVEKHYDYAKADSNTYNHDDKTFTLRLRKLSALEKRILELEKFVATLSK